jgi:MFS family permease
MITSVTSARALPRPVLILGLVSLLNDASSEMIYPLLPLFLTTTLGATPLIVGAIEGGADALASILKLFAGSISDRMPARKPLVVAGYSLATASRLIIAAALAWPVVLMARLIDRTGKGIRSAPRDAVIADVTAPEQRGRAFGFHRALDHAGAVIGPLAAAALLAGGLVTRNVIALAAVPGVIGVLLLLRLKEPPRVTRTQDGAPASAGPLPRKFWHALSAVGLFSLANSSDAFLLVYASAAGASALTLTLLWSANHAVKALLSTKAGAFSDRADRRYLLLTGWVLYSGIYLAFPFVESIPAMFVLFSLYALPFALTEGAERAWIGDIIPAEVRGKAYGWYYLVSGAGVFFGTLLFGALYQEVSPWAAFATGAGLAIAAGVLVMTVKRHAQ